MGTRRKLKNDDILIMSDDVKISKINPDLSHQYQILNELYSNPIASIVRELSSNALDATLENNSNEPVIVKLHENTFSVIDKGIGISPERAENNYFAYLQTTKEGTTQIGMYGIGAKCPLAYTNEITIITVFDNIKYTYLQFLNEDRIPSYLLLKKEDVDEPTGTKIIIKIKKQDRYLFHNEMENLIFNKNIFLLSDYAEINNNEKIYEFDTFKIKESDIENSYYNSRFLDSFILLNDIKYPINWDNLNVDKINLKIGIKFDVDEITPSITRENIFYDKKNIEIIENKIKKCREEIFNIYLEQNKDSKRDFRNLFTQINHYDSFYIKIDDKMLSLTHANIGEQNNIFYYEKFPDIKVKKYPNPLFYDNSYIIEEYGDYYKVIRTYYSKIISRMENIHTKYVKITNHNKSSIVSEYINNNYGKCVLFKKKYYSTINQKRLLIEKFYEYFDLDRSKNNREFFNYIYEKEKELFENDNTIIYNDLKKTLLSNKQTKKKKNYVRFNEIIYKIENKNTSFYNYEGVLKKILYDENMFKNTTIIGDYKLHNNKLKDIKWFIERINYYLDIDFKIDIFVLNRKSLNKLQKTITKDDNILIITKDEEVDEKLMSLKPFNILIKLLDIFKEDKNIDIFDDINLINLYNHNINKEKINEFIGITNEEKIILYIEKIIAYYNSFDISQFEKYINISNKYIINLKNNLDKKINQYKENIKLYENLQVEDTDSIIKILKTNFK